MDCKAYMKLLQQEYRNYSVDEIPDIINEMGVPPECFQAVFNAAYDTAKTGLTRAGLDALDHYMAEVNKYPLLGEEEEKKAFTQYHRHPDRGMRNLLIKTNLRLVINIARKYINRDNKSMLLDLIEEGNIGLMIAIEKFDPSRENRFATYAAYWIKHYIQEYLYKNTSILKFSDRVFHKYLRYKKIVNHKNSTNSQVSEEELKKELNVDSYSLMVLSSLFYRPLQLEEEADSPGNGTENVSVEDESEEMLMKNAVHQRLLQALTELNERERAILDYRYGIYGEEVISLREIGDILGISKQRVSQIEKNALKKLANKLKKE
ncbi:MAG TPA: sigma-70 family RNA polymerase sigma factor [Candidatus Mcinerneyibacteriales bacterium]|nr:sigma-70 family RNA polymerase sigma factor [Candidatus Mcinerneyibacteriales bacterium]HPE21096.1 sigma-70 family RNA polymerase sigma factor [Candidatus Mcinerneyibacteriales bacterium]HPJ69978.1 sigma-70 family RNA polymerase sigma factor [Candidatus Mcinerneyibacteriales bacterium]HPQ89506.1 sigma-70 family RNA polymerase sigma factor [Candidatus Mcinerneyibacteriales bacterium]